MTRDPDNTIRDTMPDRYVVVNGPFELRPV